MKTPTYPEPDPNLPPTGWSKRALRRTLGYVAVMLFLAQGWLDSNLARYHAGGATGHSLSDLANSNQAVADAARAAWKAGWSQSAKRFTPVSAPSLAHTTLLVDSAFIVAYLLFGVMVLRQAKPDARTKKLRQAAIVLLGLGAVCDLYENALLWQWISDPNPFGAPLARVAALLKYALPLLAIALHWLARRIERGDDQRGRVPVSLSVPLLLDGVLIALVFAGDIGAQLDDSVRIAATSPMKTALAVAALLSSTLVVHLVGAAVAEGLSEPAQQSFGPVIWGLPSGLLIGVGLLWHAPGAILLGGLGAVIAFVELFRPIPGTFQDRKSSAQDLPLSRAAKAATETERSSEAAEARRLLPYLRSVPSIALAVVVARVAVANAIRQDWNAFLGAMAVFVVLSAFGMALTFWPKPNGFTLKPAPWIWTILNVGVIALWIVFAVAVQNPMRGRRVGVLGAFFAFAALATFVAGTLNVLTVRREPPFALEVLGARRVPIVIIALAALFASTVLAKHSSFHDAHLLTQPRPKDGKQPPPRTSLVEPKDAFTKWVAANLEQTNPPLVIVTASGGGIRAATWTASVLDCVFGLNDATTRAGGNVAINACGEAPLPWRTWFAGGGASGGSIGMASMLARRDQLVSAKPRDNEWIPGALGVDHVSASFAWQVLAEAPAAIIRADIGEDRARKLERSWEQALLRPGDTQGFYARYTTAPPTTGPLAWQPYLSFNSTNASDGCRVNISALALAAPERPRLADDGTDQRERGQIGQCAASTKSVGPGNDTHDLFLALCQNQDVTLATAAFLSARFPVVSPAGRVESCNVDDSSTFELVDGGYRENSGAGPMADLVERLNADLPALNKGTPVSCVQPVLIEIENGYGAPYGQPGPAGSLFESFRPLTAALGSVGTETKQSPGRLRFEMQQLASTLSRTVPGCSVKSTVVHFRLEDEPGLRAPLGWSLSNATRQALSDQLGAPENRRALQTLCKLASSTACPG